MVNNQVWKLAIHTPQNYSNRDTLRYKFTNWRMTFRVNFTKQISGIFKQENTDIWEQFSISKFLFDVVVCGVSKVELLQRHSLRQLSLCCTPILLLL